MNNPCANRVICWATFSGLSALGNFVGFLVGYISGRVVGSINGGIYGSLVGSLIGTVSIARITGEIRGSIEDHISGPVTGFVVGDMEGTIDADVTGDVTGDFCGTIDGTVNGQFTGTFEGLIDGVAFSGAINQVVNGTMDGEFCGTMNATVNADMDGTIDANVDARIVGKIDVKFNGEVDLTIADVVITDAVIDIIMRGTFAGDGDLVLDVITDRTRFNGDVVLRITDDGGRTRFYLTGTRDGVPTDPNNPFTGPVTGHFIGYIVGFVTGTVVGSILGIIMGDVVGTLIGTVSRAQIIGIITGSIEDHITGTIKGTVNGTFDGTINGTVNGTFNGTFNGLINGVPFNGVINQVVNGVMVGTFTGTMNATVDGEIDGDINADVTLTDSNVIIKDGTLNIFVNGFFSGDGDLEVDLEVEDVYLKGDGDLVITGEPDTVDPDGTNFKLNGSGNGIPTDPDFPFINDSTEPPDPDDPIIILFRPPGMPPGPPELCIPTTEIVCDGGFGGGGGGNDPPIIVYTNSAQTCFKLCDGVSISYTYPAGKAEGSTQEAADQAAMTFACEGVDLKCETGVDPEIFYSTEQTCSPECGVSYTAPAGTGTGFTQAEADEAGMNAACIIAALLCPVNPILPPTFKPPGGDGGIPTDDGGGGGGGDDGGGGGGGGGGSGGVTPPMDNNPPVIYANSSQTCTVACETGGLFSHTVASGQFYGISAADANAKAYSYACNQATEVRFCLSLLEDSMCVDAAFSHDFSIQGPVEAASWLVTGLPTGLALSDLGTGGLTKRISGTPTATGTFTATFTITNTENGVELVTTRIFNVIGISTSAALPEAELDVEYSTTLDTFGMTAPVEFLITSGTLPTGLELNSGTGIISGTPTDLETAIFTVGANGEEGIQCLKEFTLPVESAEGLWNIQWGAVYNDPGTPPTIAGYEFNPADYSISVNKGVMDFTDIQGVFTRPGIQTYTGPTVSCMATMNVLVADDGSIQGHPLKITDVTGGGSILLEVDGVIYLGALGIYNFFFDVPGGVGVELGISTYIVTGDIGMPSQTSFTIALSVI